MNARAARTRVLRSRRSTRSASHGSTQASSSRGDVHVACRRRKAKLHLWRARGTSGGGDAFQGSEAGAPSKDERSTRRTVTVEFTCDVCGTRNAKNVNPKALVRGTVYVQCDGCETYHRLVDNLNWWGKEYDLRDETANPSASEDV
mmetsp:Transcript_6901/g.42114  ORF Transcript_6901/g.42114 Transcript_6901/m.42114 type:complete len:146 (-) Transcript_6901:1089-1526(-)